MSFSDLVRENLESSVEPVFDGLIPDLSVPFGLNVFEYIALVGPVVNAAAGVSRAVAVGWDPEVAWIRDRVVSEVVAAESYIDALVVLQSWFPFKAIV